VSWTLAWIALAAAAGAAWLLKLPLDLQLNLAPNAASLRLIALRWPLIHARLVWKRASGRLRVRAVGGRWSNRPVGLSGWWHGPAQLVRNWRLTRPYRERKLRRTLRWTSRALLRRLRLGRIQLAVHHGSGRPDRTGYLCAGYWSLAGLWSALRPLVSIAYVPEFGRQIFRASARTRVTLPLYLVPLLLYLLLRLRWAGGRSAPDARSGPDVEGGLDATRRV
jgi:hypothetical protein